MNDHNYLLEGLQAVRASGRANMFDKNAVVQLLAVSNSNLHGSEYPSSDNVSPDQLQAYINVCGAFVRGEINLDLIQAQAEELLKSQVRR